MTQSRTPVTSKKRAPSRAERFRAEVTKAKPQMSAGEAVLLEEACRLVDRLDRMDAILRGDLAAWASIEWPFEDAPAALVLTSVVGEARSYAAELRQVVKALAIPAAAAERKSVVDELREKREARPA